MAIILLWTFGFKEKFETCLQLQNFQNPFCHIFETLLKYIKKNVNSVQIYRVLKFISAIVLESIGGLLLQEYLKNCENL